MIGPVVLARPAAVSVLATALWLVLATPPQDAGATPSSSASSVNTAHSEATTSQSSTAQAPTSQAPTANLAKAFAAQGIHLDVEHGLCAIHATVDIREDLLEYLVVNPRGAAHESTFVTGVVPSQLNVALLALGVKPGHNASWSLRDPAPTPEEMHAGTSAYVVKPPEGDGFYIYAAWKSGGESFLYRVEDLLLDRATGQTMRRHKWVYLGSRLVHPRDTDAQEAFAADLEGNIVNIALFEQGNTLVTAALQECLTQTIWMTNFWLVPPRDSDVEIIFSRERLASLPADLELGLPVVAAQPPAGTGR